MRTAREAGEVKSMGLSLVVMDIGFSQTINLGAVASPSPENKVNPGSESEEYADS